MRALYVGYAKGTENHGDEALQWIIRDLLAPELDVRADWKEYDVALLGGGTLINQSPWLIDHFESTLNRAKVGGLVFGTGVGDVAFWGNTFDRWVPLLKRCVAVGVRGPESRRLLREHEFEDAVACGDPYLWLKAPVERDVIPKRLGVNFGSTNNSLWGSTDNELRDTMYDVLVELASRGWTFAFVSVWSKDLPILQEIATRLEAVTGTASVVLDSRTDVLECYSALAGCELFLGEKLHACAMAAVVGVPFIALEYQPKVRDFAESLNMQKWTLSTAGLDEKLLVEKVEELHATRDDVSKDLAKAREQTRGEIVRFAAHAKSKLLHAGALIS